MAKKRVYTEDVVRRLTWDEHVRLRPGMYIGSVNQRGLAALLTETLSGLNERNQLAWVELAFSDDLTIGLRIPSSSTLVNTWAEPTFHQQNPFTYDLCIINSLSSSFRVGLADKGGTVLWEERYERGKPISGSSSTLPTCTSLVVELKLDREVWGAEFDWNHPFTLNALREFAALSPNTRLDITYSIDSAPCREIIRFRNGLADLIKLETLKGLEDSYLQTAFAATTGDLQFNVAVAFRKNSIDPPFLKSYVSHYYTHEGGTHQNSLLDGLVLGIEKYRGGGGPAAPQNLSREGVRSLLVGAIQVRMAAPVFSGATKNRLGSESVAEPITDEVATRFYETLLAEPDNAANLLRQLDRLPGSTE